MSLKVKGLYVYPVKSCNGIEVSEAVIGEKGFLYDRYWIIIDAKGEMVTMRQNTGLGKIRTALVKEDGRVGVVMNVEGGSPLKVMEMEDSTKRVDVTVFENTLEKALDCGDEAGAWVDSVLGKKTPTFRLVQCPKDRTGRIVDMTRSEGQIPGEFTMGFADEFPYLLLLQSSLDKINLAARESPSFEPAKHTLDVRRFRPNILVEGTVPFDDDDDWLQIEVGDAVFNCASACERCVMTTINPDTLKFDRGAAPSNSLSLLKKYHKWSRGALFGQHCVSQSVGTTIRKGDSIYVQSRKTAAHTNRDLGREPTTSHWPLCAALSLALTTTVAALAWRSRTRGTASVS